MTGRGLYIHIPFCRRKCSYCDFYSVATDTDSTPKYFEALIAEIKNTARIYPDSLIETVYIGGGTPSAVPVPFIAETADAVYKYFHTDIKEFTIECNPDSSEGLSEYKKYGIDRVSIGVQSLNPATLKRIGRIHSADQALTALKRAADLGYRVSADLIAGLPGESEADVAESVKGVASLVRHISMYMLKLSDSSPMGRAAAAGQISLPSDDLSVDMYDAGFAELKKRGFSRYEISNFALPGCESLHNLGYWKRKEYFGLGAAAHGFIGSKRFENPSDVRQYSGGKNFGAGKAAETLLSYKDAVFEYIMLGLRLEDGFSLADFEAKFGFPFESKYLDIINKLRGVLMVTDGRAYIEPSKMLIESAVAREFLI